MYAYGGAYSGPRGSGSYLPQGSGPIDAYGNVVQSNQPVYVARINYNSAIAGMPQGPGQPVYAVNPNYIAPSPITGAGGGNNIATTTTPPHYRVTFDAIGQTIYRSIGHARLPMRTIWAQGIEWPGNPEDVISPKLTFAAALCAPIDPDEEGEVTVLLAGSNVIYDRDGGGIQIPDGLSVEDAAALQLSLENAVVYPGTETQMPAPLIVADKGADKTNAFRGIRYIVLPLYPLIEGFGFGGGLTVGWERTNDIIGYTPAAVEFAAGAT